MSVHAGMCRPTNTDLLKVYRMAERGMTLDRAYDKVRDDGGDPGSWWPVGGVNHGQLHRLLLLLSSEGPQAGA